MKIIITILFILNALLLVGVVLIQQPKTSAGLFSGTGQSLLGTSGKSFWTKFTTILAAVFMVLCLLMSFVRHYEQAPGSVTDPLDKQQPKAASPSQVPVSASAQALPKPAVNPAPIKQEAPQAVPPSSGSKK